MKKILAVIFSVSLGISVVFAGNVAASAASVAVKSQVSYVKRKSKRVYHRTKRGTKVVYYKSKHGTKKTYYKSKRVTKRTYHKTKDKVTE